MNEMYIDVMNLEAVSKEAEEILVHVRAIRELQDKLHSYRGGIHVRIGFEEVEGGE